MLRRLLSRLSKWSYCQKCCDRTDQEYIGPLWKCLSCGSKVDRDGRVK